MPMAPTTNSFSLNITELSSYRDHDTITEISDVSLSVSIPSAEASRELRGTASLPPATASSSASESSVAVSSWFVQAWARARSQSRICHS